MGSGFVRSLLRESQFEARAFLTKIDAWVLARLEQGASTFRDVLSGLPGIYPSEVLCSLRRLQGRDKIQEFDVLAVELDAASKPVLHSQSVCREKRFIEHPLDFEWRFTSKGVARIGEEIKAAGLKKAEILCLGCPSVYLFGKDQLKGFSFRLWDKNNATAGQIEEAREICRLDLQDANPPFPPADIVVIDPPWYRSFYELFLWAGIHCLPVGGRLFLSFPPEGTRSTAAAELISLLKWCEARGLSLERKYPGSLPYRSPLFEMNALRAQGITNYPIDWRRGDLVLLTKRRQIPFDKPKCAFPSEKWEEVRLRNSRIKVSHGKKIPGAAFQSTGENEIVPSVSSKHADRKRANVVTSGNRFIRTNRPEAVYDCLSAIEASGPDSMRKDFIASKHPLLMQKVIELVSKEEKEAHHYFRRIHEL